MPIFTIPVGKFRGMCGWHQGLFAWVVSGQSGVFSARTFARFVLTLETKPAEKVGSALETTAEAQSMEIRSGRVSKSSSLHR